MSEVAQNEPVESTPQEELTDLEQVNSVPEGADNEAIAVDAPEEPVKRADKRISQLTWEKHELERQKNAEIEALKQQLEQKQAAAPVVHGKPERKDFDYDDDLYIEALAEWKTQQAVKQFAETQAKQTQQQAEQQAAAAWSQKAQSYAMENPEYLELTQQRGNAVTSQAVANYLTSSDNGAKLHHELLDNFSELQRIQSLPEWQQGAELAKLELKTAQVKPKAQSKAPQPVAPVSTAKPAAKSGGSIFPTNW